MSKETSPTISKGAHSRRRTLLADEWLAGLTKPSPDRILTPSQRQQLADSLRFARRVKWDKTLVVLR